MTTWGMDIVTPSRNKFSIGDRVVVDGMAIGGVAERPATPGSADWPDHVRAIFYRGQRGSVLALNEVDGGDHDRGYVSLDYAPSVVVRLDGAPLVQLADREMGPILFREAGPITFSPIALRLMDPVERLAELAD